MKIKLNWTPELKMAYAEIVFRLMDKELQLTNQTPRSIFAEMNLDRNIYSFGDIASVNHNCLDTLQIVVENEFNTNDLCDIGLATYTVVDVLNLLDHCGEFGTISDRIDEINEVLYE